MPGKKKIVYLENISFSSLYDKRLNGEHNFTCSMEKGVSYSKAKKLHLRSYKNPEHYTGKMLLVMALPKENF
jgi:hypothetical protein